jgi:hypothetical protein
MSRIGEPTNNTNPIVGKWSFKAAYKGVMVFRQFIADGRSLFSIPMEEKNGRYKLKDNVLTITEVNKEPYIRNIKIYNNKLILLPTKDNKAETYIRFYKD